MSRPNPTRPYSFPGFRVALVREPGVMLSERPSLTRTAGAARGRVGFGGDMGRAEGKRGRSSRRRSHR